MRGFRTKVPATHIYFLSTCHVTHSYMSHMTQTLVLCDSSGCGALLYGYKRLSHLCHDPFIRHVTHWYMTCWFDICVWSWPCVRWCVLHGVCVTWCALDGVPASWHTSSWCACVMTYLMCACVMTYLMTYLILRRVSHTSFICVTSLLRLYRIPHSYVWHDSLKYVRHDAYPHRVWARAAAASRLRRVPRGGMLFLQQG